MMARGATAESLEFECLSDRDVRPLRRPAFGPAKDLLSGPGVQRVAAYKVPDGGVLTVHYGDELPGWFPAVMKRLLELLQLPAGWEGTVAHRVHPRCAQNALNLLFNVLDDDGPAPSIVPASSGFLQMEWHCNALDVQIEQLPGHRLHLAFEDHKTGGRIDRELATDLSELTRCLSLLTTNVHRIGAVGLGAIPVETPPWLEDVYSLVEQRDHESAGRLIFEQVNELLAGDGSSRCNDLLHVIDLKRLDTYSVVAVLSITLAAATRLAYRDHFVTRATARLKELAPDRVDRLLAGLK